MPFKCKVVSFKLGHTVRGTSSVHCIMHKRKIDTRHLLSSQYIKIFHVIFMRDSIYAIARVCYRPSVCPFVRPQDGWIIEKRLKLGIGL